MTTNTDGAHVAPVDQPIDQPDGTLADPYANLDRWPAWARSNHYTLSLVEVVENIDALADSIDAVLARCPADLAPDPESHGGVLVVLSLLREQVLAQSRVLQRLAPADTYTLIDLEKAGLIDDVPGPRPWQGVA